MATQRQIAANRANALRSTGPRSVAGRKAASKNAHKSGVSSQGSYDAEPLAEGDCLRSIAVSPHTDGTLDGSPLSPEIAQAEAWLAEIRSMLREVDDRIDLLIAAGGFKRPDPDAYGPALLHTLGLPDTASATVRKAAERFLKDPGIAAILDPVTALLQERALLIRYRQEAEAARRSRLHQWAPMGGDRGGGMVWPASDQT